MKRTPFSLWIPLPLLLAAFLHSISPFEAGAHEGTTQPDPLEPIISITLPTSSRTTAPDTTPPTVAITSPTSGSTYATGSGSISLGGSAADNVGVTQVTWINDRGGSGTASGTAGWSVAGIVLQEGVNVITVTGRDAAGNAGTATLTVT
jgi:hypothetical protein